MRKLLITAELGMKLTVAAEPAPVVGNDKVIVDPAIAAITVPGWIEIPETPIPTVRPVVLEVRVLLLALHVPLPEIEGIHDHPPVVSTAVKPVMTPLPWSGMVQVTVTCWLPGVAFKMVGWPGIPGTAEVVAVLATGDVLAPVTTATPTE